MEQTIKERIMLFVKAKELSANKFEKLCGLSFRYLSNLKKSPSPEMLEKIFSTFPELNRTWLLTGEGDMIVGNTATATASGATAVAGNGNSITPAAPSLDTDRLLSIIERQQQQLARASEQISQLIALAARDK